MSSGFVLYRVLCQRQSINSVTNFVYSTKVYLTHQRKCIQLVNSSVFQLINKVIFFYLMIVSSYIQELTAEAGSKPLDVYDTY